MPRLQTLVTICVLLAFPFIANGAAIIGSLSNAGNITLTPTSGPVQIVGINFESAAGLLVPPMSPAPFDFTLASQSTVVAAGNLGTFFTLDSPLVTSVVYNGDPTSGDLTLEYGDSSFQVVSIPIEATPPSAVPEPASIAIWFALVGLVGLRVCRQKVS